MTIDSTENSQNTLRQNFSYTLATLAFLSVASSIAFYQAQETSKRQFAKRCARWSAYNTTFNLDRYSMRHDTWIGVDGDDRIVKVLVPPGTRAKEVNELRRVAHDCGVSLALPMPKPPAPASQLEKRFARILHLK